MKKLYAVFIMFLVGLNLMAQRNINDYKYVVVPAQYNFLGEDDKYQLNSLTKFLFNKYGYTAFMEVDELPSDLRENSCLGLYANLLNDNSLFKTKVQLEVKDCNGTVILRSKVGETREKLYDKAFKIALREAFETFQHADYRYLPQQKQVSSVIDRDDSPANVNVVVEDDGINEASGPTKVTATKNITDKAVQPEILDAKDKAAGSEPTTVASDVLYAQPIKDGYQIVDTEPKKVMVLYSSGLKDVFIVEGKSAVVFKKDGEWYYEEYIGNLMSKKLNIKF